MTNRSHGKCELRFGTSGLRDTVENMTDEEVYINTSGFLRFLEVTGELSPGGTVAVGGDLRPSTPKVAAAVGAAIGDGGYAVDYCGAVPSPALALYARSRGRASVMVTGSHIPADRNGVKFTKRAGEVLKSDEAGILEQVAAARRQEWAIPLDQCRFALNGAFKEPAALPPAHDVAAREFVQRYLDVFPPDCLDGVTVAVYQHSAVGRDLVVEILRGLGATVVAPTETITVEYTDDDTGETRREEIDLRSESFVPVDTEKVTAKTRAVLAHLVGAYHPDFIVSTDGDSDRPLFADETGQFLPGDKLGALALRFLVTVTGGQCAFTAVPVSTNDGVVHALRASGVEVQLTKIGSPYVIAAMQAANAGLVVGWEANGGFLVQSDLPLFGNTLPALPTRDAVLPLVATMLLIKASGVPASQFLSQQLPARYNVAAVTDHTSPGAEAYTADLGKAIVASLTPQAAPLIEAEFDGDEWRFEFAAAQPTDQQLAVLRQELQAVRQQLEPLFAPLGLRTLRAINYLDGVRLQFAEGEVVYHLRPSGNAPEFRTYVTANSPAEAQRLLEGRKRLVPALIAAVAQAA